MGLVAAGGLRSSVIATVGGDHRRNPCCIAWSVRPSRSLSAALTSRLRGNADSDRTRMVGPSVGHGRLLSTRPSSRCSRSPTPKFHPGLRRCSWLPRSLHSGCSAMYQEKPGYSTNNALAEDLAATHASQANMSFAAALVHTLEESDQYTAGHSQGGCDLHPRHRADEWVCPRKRQRARISAASSTTSGRSGCRQLFSDKEGPLTLEERRQMQKHSEIGERILLQGRCLRRHRKHRAPSP